MLRLILLLQIVALSIEFDRKQKLDRINVEKTASLQYKKHYFIEDNSKTIVVFFFI